MKTTITFLGLLLAISLLALPMQAQTIRYVKAGATGDGSSWAAASGDLQAMISISSPNEPTVQRQTDDQYVANARRVGFLATQVYAVPITTHKPNGSEVTLEQQLAKYISYPHALKPMKKAGVVVIQFRINSDNELCQLEVFTKNERLTNELLRQLAGIKLKGYQHDLGEFAQQVHTVRLRFNPQ